MRAIGYIRVSTASQAEQGVSLQQQSDAIRRWALANNAALIDIVMDEDVSGGKPLARRPGGAALIALAERERPEVIVSTYVDRLFRDTLDGLRSMRELFPRLGARVVLVAESLDLTTPFGKFQATTRLAAAEFERDLIRDRAKRTNNALRDAGRVWGGVPYGMREVAGHVLRDASTWAHREEIVHLARAEGLSLREIRDTLRRTGVPAPAGGTSWSIQTIANLLRTHGALLRMLSERERTAPAVATH